MCMSEKWIENVFDVLSVLPIIYCASELYRAEQVIENTHIAAKIINEAKILFFTILTIERKVF